MLALRAVDLSVPIVMIHFWHYLKGLSYAVTRCAWPPPLAVTCPSPSPLIWTRLMSAYRLSLHLWQPAPSVLSCLRLRQCYLTVACRRPPLPTHTSCRYALPPTPSLSSPMGRPTTGVAWSCGGDPSYIRLMVFEMCVELWSKTRRALVIWVHS
jgi:hypothetical protein